MSDYYDILNVSKNSTQQEIKKAYRKVAMKYHPDRNPDNKEAENKFKEAAAAYAVLSDENKKNRYDQLGHEQYSKFGAADGGFSGGINVEDIFNSVFGGGGGFGDFFGGDIFGNSRRKSKTNFGGRDLKISLPLTLEEIYTGKNKKIKIKRWEKNNSSPSVCPKCNGKGEVRFVQQSMLGQIVNVQACSYCAGIGYTGGREKKTVNISIKIPPGVHDGNYMTMNGEGDKSIKGENHGDLIVSFEEKNHELFIRDGNDLYIDCFINYPDAVLGVEIEVPTLDKKVKMKIPPGIKNNQLLRLRGKGFPELNRHKYGDLYVKINVQVLTQMNNHVTNLIKELKENIDNNVRFQKIKNMSE